MEIVPGIIQVSIPLPIDASANTNAYVIRCNNGVALIDTGCDSPKAVHIIKEQLEAIDLALKDIGCIIVTHAHFDHCGLASRLKEVSGAQIIMSKPEAYVVENRWIKHDSFSQMMSDRFRKHGVPDNDINMFLDFFSIQRKHMLPVLPDKQLVGGEILSLGSFKFKVLLTAGHSIGHICLYEQRQGLLFSGDTLLTGVTPIADPFYDDNALGNLEDSLNALSSLQVDIVLPGHGAVFSGAKQKIERTCHTIEQRRLAICQTVTDKPRTAYEISKELFMKVNNTDTWKNVNSNKRLVRFFEVFGQLGLLVNNHLVEEIMQNEMISYRTLA